MPARRNAKEKVTDSEEAKLQGLHQAWVSENFPASNANDHGIQQNNLLYSEKFQIPISKKANEHSRFTLFLDTADLGRLMLLPPSPGAVLRLDGLENGLIRQVDPDSDFVDKFKAIGGWSSNYPGLAIPVLTTEEITQLNACAGDEQRLHLLFDWVTSVEFYLPDENGVNHRKW
jgi:hypothetical protein